MVSAADTYTLIVMDGACNSQTQQAIISDGETPDIDIQIISSNNIIDCNTTFVELEGNSTDDVSYSWEGPNGFMADTPTIQANTAGMYTLTITSINNDCTSQQNVEVFDEISPPSVEAEGGVIDCTNNNTLLSALTPIPNSTYTWTGPNNFSSNEQNPSVSVAGEYTVVVTSGSNGCTEELTVMALLDENFPVLEANAQDIDCINTSSVLDASLSTPAGDSIMYQWYLDDNPIGMNEIAPSIESGGTYQLIGMNTNNGCTDTLQVEVAANITEPVADAGEDAQITCDEDMVTIDASNSQGDGLSYQWFNYGGDLISEESSLDIDTASPYTLVVTDENNCTDSDDISITDNSLEPLATIELSSTAIDCINTMVELDGNPNQIDDSLLNYEWLDEDGQTIGNSSTQTVNTAGNYTLLVTNTENGCSSDSFVIVDSTIEKPTLNIAQPDMLSCNNTSVLLDASGSDDASNYFSQWFDENNMIIDSNTLNLTVDQAGTYTLLITNTDTGCSEQQSITVNSNQNLPNAVASAANALSCEGGGDVELQGDGSSTGVEFEYAWSGPSIISATNTLNITVDAAGDYTLIVSNTNNGCTAEANINVPAGGGGINTAPISVEDEACFGDNNGLISIGEIQGGNPPYLYSINGGVFTQNPQFSNLAPGNYDLLIQDIEGCEYTESLVVEGATPINIELGDNLVIQLGETVDLNLQTTADLDTVIWSDMSLVGSNPSFAPSNQTTISVTVTDENGCTETDAITIFIEKDRPVYIPSAFSPNEDGINDVFMIFGSEAIANVRVFKVYDRWGELVFSDSDFLPNDQQHGWNGLFRDKFLNPQVFVYYTEIEFTDGIVEIYKGDVTLMR